MAPRTRKAEVGQPVQNNKNRLAFRDKLAAKSISADSLLKRLGSLHTQLAALDQDSVETDSLDNARTELIHVSLLLHKDRGVKAYTACCLSDILRLYAPDAPYTQDELRDIFQFFFRQLTAGFKGQDEPYYNEYFHLLESLSTFKSVVLVCDLPNAEELLHEIFRDLFTIVKRDFTKKIEMFMCDILSVLIEECASLPSDALEVLMSQFIDRNARIDQPGYRLAVLVCNKKPVKLQRYVCQYFSDLLAASVSLSDEVSSSEQPSEEYLETIRTSHDLIKKLHHSCPEVLHSVIPILETELRADGLLPRMMATQTLGEMYADPKHGVELMKQYPSTWTTWIYRKSDTAVQVRVKCVEALPALLTNLAEAKDTLEDMLINKLLDPDDRVRAAACKVYSHLDYEAAMHHVSETQLRAVAGRGLDKKKTVRVEALNTIGKIYSLAYPEISNRIPAAIKQFAWIPDEILQMSHASPDVKALVDSVLFEYILPLPGLSFSSFGDKGLERGKDKGKEKGKEKEKDKDKEKDKEIDEASWTDRLLLVMRYLSEKSLAVLITMSGLKSTRPNVYDVFLEACIKNNGGIIDTDEEATIKRLKASTQHIAASFPDAVKASEDLLAFAKLNENRLYKLLKTCMDPQTDLKGLVKTSHEFLKRIDQLSTSILPTMITFLHRSSYGIVNQSSIPTLLKRLHSAANIQSTSNSNLNVLAPAESAQSLLVVVAKHSPALLKSHVAELCKAAASTDEGKGKEKEKERRVGNRLVECALMCLAGVVRWDEKVAANVDKKTVERIISIALSDDFRQAKFAARFLAFSKNKDEVCTEVVESIASTISNKEKAVKGSKKLAATISSSGPLPAAQVAALAQLARFAPNAFEQKSDVIMTHLIKRVVMMPCSARSNEADESNGHDDDSEEEWIENEDMSDGLRAKIFALKVCRNRCLAHVGPDTEPEQALEIASPVLKLLATLVEYDGSLAVATATEGDDEPAEDPKVKTRMRLQAAISMLNLATVHAFSSALEPKFIRLACVIQDSCFNVRLAFLTKLLTLLQPRKLPPRYNVIPFLTVLDPEAETKTLAAAYVETTKRRMPPAIRVEHLEIIFLRLLHLLAHHPDFDKTQDELMDMATYLHFYLELVASSENVSFLYHLAQKGKTVRDADSHAYSENFYIMCEIAQNLIKAKANSTNWSLHTYPGKVKFPMDILKPLPSAAATNEILKTEYLPAEANDWLNEKFKIGGVKEKKERKERVPSKRKNPPAKTNGHAKRSRRRKSHNHTDDEMDEDGPSSDAEGSDVEMGDVTANASRSTQRKSDASEETNPRLTRAERLNARTQAKERLSSGSKKAAAQSDDDG